MDKQNYTPLVNISNVYRFMENYDKAIEYALKASELHTSAYGALAIAYFLLKDEKMQKRLLINIYNFILPMIK
ncbi:tetratricopeptide repeat protein [Brachyspira alvinipulli]|uniref:tetratricopeptide repeat protein n=1 Tax=Brachyspira alvinipulli TaxID=84379 RepID=UPI00047F165C